MTVRAAFASHEAYIAAMPAPVQAVLLQVQARVEAALPAAVRCISYGMPAYRGDKKVFFYFAGFKQHLGIYPPVKQDPALMAELAPFRNEKGNLSFPYKHPIPYDLIVKVALCLAKEYALNAAVTSRGATMPSEEKAKGPASYFPSIEKKYGQPINHWLGLVAGLQGMKHMERVAWLKSEHGFGHGHANAVVAHVLADKSS